MSILNKIGLTIGTDTQVEAVFESLHKCFLDVEYEKPSDYINIFCELYSKSPIKNNNLNGKVFECILSTLFIRERLLPFYINAKVAFVPNVVYDIMYYTSERGPICISAKTSLRERYKQADLEAIALKYVHRRALCYLVTLDVGAAASVKEKITKGDVIGIDKVVIANSPEFDELVAEIKEFDLSDPPTFKVIESNQIINQAKIDALEI